MKTTITSVAELGLLLRATRKASGIRADDLAACARVGHVFVRDVEHGKPTVQLGRVLKLLDELGIRLEAQVPDSVLPEFERLKARGLRPARARRAGAATLNETKPPRP